MSRLSYAHDRANHRGNFAGATTLSTLFGQRYQSGNNTFALSFLWQYDGLPIAVEQPGSSQGITLSPVQITAPRNQFGPGGILLSPHDPCAATMRTEMSTPAAGQSAQTQERRGLTFAAADFCGFVWCDTHHKPPNPDGGPHKQRMPRYFFREKIS